MLNKLQRSLVLRCVWHRTFSNQPSMVDFWYLGCELKGFVRRPGKQICQLIQAGLDTM